MRRQESRGTQDTQLGPSRDSQKGFVHREGPEAAAGEHGTHTHKSQLHNEQV